MVWCDTYYSKGTCLPKWLYCITSLGGFVLSLLTIYSALETIGFMEKIIPAVGAIYFLYLTICNVFLILKGSQYVKIIKKEQDHFILTNIFKKHIHFTVSDILSLKASSNFFIIDKFLTGFAKHISGLELILKDGSRYYITCYMENTDTLKEHLLGKVDFE